jgi:hypothetical protein
MHFPRCFAISKFSTSRAMKSALKSTMLSAIAAFCLGAAPAQTPNSAPSAQSPAEKPSPYQGVSVPPADDAIVTSGDAPAAEPAQAGAPNPAPTPAQSVNPDSHIVGEALPATAETQTPELQTRTAADYDDEDQPDPNAGSEIVTALYGPPNALPAGTTFRVRLLETIRSNQATPGMAFHATLSQDLTHEGRVVVPIGSELRGKVVYAATGNHLNGEAALHLVPEQFILPDGSAYQIHGQVIDTAGSDTKATQEGLIVPKIDVKKSLALVGAGAGGGALFGAKVAGGMGAAVGTAVGAGAMTAHWLLVERVADLPTQSTLVISLSDPMFLAPVSPLRN